MFGIDDAVAAVSNTVSTVVNKIWPDATEAQKIALQRELAAQDGELRLALAQIDVNKVEAASESFWKSGWRPGAGWVGVSAAFCATTVPFFVQTVLWTWSCLRSGEFLPAPTPDLTQVFLMLGQLLGFGYYRSQDKKNGSAQ